ncbi:MAG: phasin family protein [Erythrobacter sp.]|nr:MAG: phasin family protein [Erythrobacter sp.]
MAQSETAKPDASAEKAYAEAAAEAKPAKAKPLVESLKADTTENTAAEVEPTPAPVSADEKPAASPPVEKVAAKATSAKPSPAKKAVAKKAPAKKAPLAKAAAPKPAAKKIAKKIVAKPAAKPVKPAPVAKTKPSVTQLKEKIMAAKTPDYTNVLTATMTDAVKEMQERTQTAFEKSTSAMTEATEFAKGNVEAVVESGKIFAESVQTMGKSYADEAKSVYETATADIKEMASIKSPTELFQLQGKIMRRNFDALMAMTSMGTDATMKLANDVMAPISGRVNLAAEKLSKVA